MMQPESYDLFLRHSLARHIIHLAIRTEDIVEKELIDTNKGAVVFADPVFVLWMRRNKNQ